MLRKRKGYSRPRKLHEMARVEEENRILKAYGLKNKKEVWKADARISKIRDQAKALITKSPEEQERFIGKLKKLGLKAEKLQDVLALGKESILDRRLQTMLVRKNIAKSPSSARQLIVHKHVLIGENAVNIPSYNVSLDEEKEISLKTKNKKVKEKSENADKAGSAGVENGRE
ncbi:30S ribosomal protein S4 [Candidatus Pacearchaeota archaeon]|nr:30S ribosomal protein S4 [Candidatus Pacearchaeota archaeon]